MASKFFDPKFKFSKGIKQSKLTSKHFLKSPIFKRSKYSQVEKEF